MILLSHIFFSLLYLAILIVLLSAMYAGFSSAPFFPTYRKDVKRILKLASIQPNQKCYDLGCGDGRIIAAFAAAQANAEGFEISFIPYCIAQLRMFFLKKRQKNIHATITLNNFWHKDLSDAKVVYFFLTTRIYPKLKSKLEKELTQGTKVICYAWPIEGWQPIAVDKEEKHFPIYLYEIK